MLTRTFTFYSINIFCSQIERKEMSNRLNFRLIKLHKLLKSCMTRRTIGVIEKHKDNSKIKLYTDRERTNLGYKSKPRETYQL